MKRIAPLAVVAAAAVLLAVPPLRADTTVIRTSPGDTVVVKESGKTVIVRKRQPVTVVRRRAPVVVEVPARPRVIYRSRPHVVRRVVRHHWHPRVYRYGHCGFGYGRHHGTHVSVGVRVHGHW